MKEKNKPNIVAVAKQQRHLQLLSKLQQGKALNKAEIEELTVYEGEGLNEKVVSSIKQVAKTFGVSTRTVDYWIRDGMPKTADGSYDIAAIHHWRIERLSKNKGHQSEADYFDIQYRKVKYELAKLDLQERTGELISLKKVQEDLGNEILIIKQKFLALPQQVACLLKGLEEVEIQKILYSKLAEIIDGFAKGKYDNERDSIKTKQQEEVSHDGVI